MLSRRTLLTTTAITGLAYASRALGADEEALLRMVGEPQDLATPTRFFDRLITPTSVFFVRSHFGPPALDARRRLVVDGMVKSPLTLTADDLRALPRVTSTAVLQCAGNGRALQVPRVPGVQWVHGAMGQATWTGVRLRDLLARAGVVEGANHVHLEAADLPPKPQVPPFLRSIPLERALDPSTLVAYEMNGAPLTLAHGAPLRLVVPGWAGDHWVKWLTGLHVQRDEAKGFFMETAYRMPVSPVPPGSAVPPADMRPATTFPVKSIIATPMDGARMKAGLVHEVRGVAFSGNAPLRGVEVSFDEGTTWSKARLEGEAGVGRWQVFRAPVTATKPGPMSAMARATDRLGATQPEHAVWNPSGYFWNAWHRVSWEVLP
jgi:DMSO/TMAO reductase YedYZ molybdopterin-dependent catalytic subunit